MPVSEGVSGPGQQEPGVGYLESRCRAGGLGEGGGRLEAPWPEPLREVVVYTENRS